MNLSFSRANYDYDQVERRINVLHLACYVNAAISIMPLINYYSPWFITAIPLLVVLYYLLLGNKNYKDAIKMGITIVMILALKYWLLHRYNLINNFLDGLIAFSPCFIAIYLFRSKDDAFQKKYIQFICLCIGITCITTIIGLYQFPNASRELASGTAIFDTTKYTMQNIGGYDFIYSLIIYLPIVAWMIKHTKRFARFINILILFALIFCIYKSQYTIAIVILLFMGVILLIPHSKTAYISFICFCVLMLLFGFHILARVFAWLSENINEEYVSDRLLQVSQLLSGSTIQTNTTTERLKHYFESQVAFTQHPLGHNWFSFSGEGITSHSSILDILGGAGIIGLAIFIALFASLYKLSVSRKPFSSCRYVVFAWIGFVIISLLNPSNFSLIYMAIFPVCSIIQKRSSVQ